jgi:hypothetical protein
LRAEWIVTRVILFLATASVIVATVLLAAVLLLKLMEVLPLGTTIRNMLFTIGLIGGVMALQAIGAAFRRAFSRPWLIHIVDVRTNQVFVDCKIFRKAEASELSSYESRVGPKYVPSGASKPHSVFTYKARSLWHFGWR